jgi:hypothetical protein
MQQYIRIRMPEQTFVKSNFYPANNQLASFDELVDVKTLSDTHYICLS